MATTSKTLFRGAAATSSTTLYTVPTTSTTTVVTNILVANTAATSATFDLSIDGVQIANDIVIAANDTLVIDLKQVIPANATPKTITGLASATTVNFHISGVEIVQWLFATLNHLLLKLELQELLFGTKVLFQQYLLTILQLQVAVEQVEDRVAAAVRVDFAQR